MKDVRNKQLCFIFTWSTSANNMVGLCYFKLHKCIEQPSSLFYPWYNSSFLHEELTVCVYSAGFQQTESTFLWFQFCTSDVSEVGAIQWPRKYLMAVIGHWREAVWLHMLNYVPLESRNRQPVTAWWAAKSGHVWFLWFYCF